MTKFKPLYQHRCGYNTYQNDKLYYIFVFITMSFKLLWEQIDLNAVFEFLDSDICVK